MRTKLPRRPPCSPLALQHPGPWVPTGDLPGRFRGGGNIYERYNGCRSTCRRVSIGASMWWLRSATSGLKQGGAGDASMVKAIEIAVEALSSLPAADQERMGRQLLT